jgi:hypothetical protein
VRATHLHDVISLRVDGRRLAAWQGGAPGGARCRIRRALPAEHALKERGSFGKLARMRQPSGFANCVLGRAEPESRNTGPTSFSKQQ